MYVVLSKAERHVPHGKLVGTTECIMLQTRCRANQDCYKRVQPQFHINIQSSYTSQQEHFKMGRTDDKLYIKNKPQNNNVHI
jgi:hypothetical protein